MTPAARIQTAIELLDRVIAAARDHGAPADRIVAEGFRQRRYAGSKDRRAIRELVFAAIRACGPIPPSGRAAMLRLAHLDPAIEAQFDGAFDRSSYGPAPRREGEPVAIGGIAPDWLIERLAASDIALEDAAALLDRAPLDIRINTLRGDNPDLPISGERTAAQRARRFPPGTPVERWPATASGAIEVQDTGSQLVCEAMAARPGETIIDLCAGAGGKTLALAAAMDDIGTLLACDTDRNRLSQVAPRAERAGATRIATRLLDPGREADQLADWEGRADRVLVDAPCSGTGTWRRNPEARWRLRPADLARLTALQDHVLRLAAPLVRPGGRLVYATCSLLDEEGCDRIAALLAAQSHWQAETIAFSSGIPRGAGVRLSPWRDGTDGFFIASLTRLW